MLRKNLRNTFPFTFLFGLFLGLAFITFSIVGFDLSTYPGDLGDARFSMYLLEHGHNYFFGGISSFWNAPFLVPEKEVITYSENFIGSVPFYSTFRLLGANRETAFQLWFVTLAVLNYSCAYLFLKWLLKDSKAAVAGALIFAFSMAIQSQLAHAQTFPRFPVPLALWMCLLFKKELDPKYFFGAIFFLVYQFYCGIYLGFMLAVPVALTLLTILTSEYKNVMEKVKKLKWLGFMTGSLAVNIVLLLLLMLPYLERATRIGEERLYEDIFNSIPTLTSFFYSKSSSIFWDSINETGVHIPNFWDHQLFPGGVAILCFFVAIVVWVIISFNRKMKNVFTSEVKIILFISVVCFLLFIRFGDFSFYEFLFELPGFNSMRSLTRIINIELIFFGIAVGVVVKLILMRLKKLPSSLIFALICTIVILDNYLINGNEYTVNKAKSRERITQLEDKMKHIPQKALISYEPDSMVISTTDVNFLQLDGMLASQSMNMKCVNGYTSTSPTGFSFYWAFPNERNREIWFTQTNFHPDTVYVIK